MRRRIRATSRTRGIVRIGNDARTRQSQKN
jgi:hypothetical protein